VYPYGMTALTARDRHSRLLRWGWYPLGLIAITLVLLYVVPQYTNTHLQRLRRHESEVTLPALVRVNDLEAALATEIAAWGEMTQGGGQVASAEFDQARQVIIFDERILDSLVAQISPALVASAKETKAAIDRWRASEDGLAARVAAARTKTDTITARRERWQALQLALAAAQKLDNELSAQVEVERQEIGRYERINVFVPTALVPLALLSLIAVVWTARRTALLTQEAAEGWQSAEQAIAAKSALIRGVTHDLKNPLGAASGYAELLADGVVGPMTENQVQIIAHLRQLIASTVDTVNDLVDLSHSKDAKLRIEQRETDVVAVTRDVVDGYRASCLRAGIALSFDAAPTPNSTILTDSTRVRQILGNLLSNAVKYTPKGSAIHVTTESITDPALGPAIAIAVADTGPGIPDHLRERVFEEFFRVPTTSSVAAGTGVGLSIARRIARLLGGDLRLEPTAGGGATFILLLPA
jgi:signal transduction histidine kinase